MRNEDKGSFNNEDIKNTIEEHNIWVCSKIQLKKLSTINYDDHDQQDYKACESSKQSPKL